MFHRQQSSSRTRLSGLPGSQGTLRGRSDCSPHHCCLYRHHQCEWTEQRGTECIDAVLFQRSNLVSAALKTKSTSGNTQPSANSVWLVPNVRKMNTWINNLFFFRQLKPDGLVWRVHWSDWLSLLWNFVLGLFSHSSFSFLDGHSWIVFLQWSLGEVTCSNGILTEIKHKLTGEMKESWLPFFFSMFNVDVSWRIVEGHDDAAVQGTRTQ